MVFWNCELDTLRGDLGLIGFPPKSVQFEFLSGCKPVYYVRQRDYAKTVSVAPFNVNYSGCLFREYPGPWQVMIRDDTGKYVCIAEDRTRCVQHLPKGYKHSAAIWAFIKCKCAAVVG